MAEKIRISSNLAPEIRQLVIENYPAFYLGNVAPDVQSVADIRREETHFYRLPPAEEELAYPMMLERYPQIAAASALSADHAVFIAAYCAHLVLDLRWYHDILIPFFLEPSKWRAMRQAFIVHNTLLTYLDKSAVAALPKTAADTLAAAQPDMWLPFASDQDLKSWRDHLVAQLRPEAMLMTVQVYASRLGIPAEEFESNLEKSSWMDEHLFSKVPVERVNKILTSAIEESADVIGHYLLA